MSDEEFVVIEAVRVGMPPVIIIWAMSGGGKTLSSLLMARGIVGPEGVIGLIDTENKRALEHADAEGVGMWYHLDLQPPFTPERYIKAQEYLIKKYNIDIAIIDSASHEWEGEGGVIEIAESQKYKDGRPMTGLKKWDIPKRRHKRFVNAALRSPIPVILNHRAKEGTEQSGAGQSAKITSTGLQPICDKGLIFEATISVLLGPDHKPLYKPIGRFSCNDVIQTVKIPDLLKGVIKPGEFISVATGEAISKWIASGKDFDKELSKLQQVSRDISHMGIERLEQHWKSLGKEKQTKLLPILPDLKATAAKADEEAKGVEYSEEDDGHEEQPETNTETASSLDDDAPEQSEKPAEEPKEPEAPATTETEKPVDNAIKEPETTEPVKLIIRSPRGDTYDCGNIDVWSNKAFAMIEKAGTDQKALNGFSKRHEAIMTEIKVAYPEQVQAVEDAVKEALTSGLDTGEKA